MSFNNDSFYLLQALQLAAIRRGFCAPNPSVGAVLVKDEQIIATGYHYAAGYPHAEIDALKKALTKAKGATIYVTLEPCCHFGKTPPCTNALIQAGVKRVVYGYPDPNPIVAGQGVAALQAAGIICNYVELPEISTFYASYSYWHQTHKPFITAKLAMSLDNKIAGKNGERLQITGEKLEQFTHMQRKTSDALLTTVKTIINDNPQLNVRLDNSILLKPLYILDRYLQLPNTAQIFHTTQALTIFHAANASLARQQELTAKGVRCISVAEVAEGLDLNQVVNYIGKDGIHDLWVEVGGHGFSAFLAANLLQRALLYISPQVVGEGTLAFTLPVDFRHYVVNWRQIGKEVMCEVTFFSKDIFE